MSSERFMTRQQASDILGKSPEWISKLMDRGKLAYVRLGKRRFPTVFSVEAMRAWMDGQEPELPGMVPSIEEMVI